MADDPSIETGKSIADAYRSGASGSGSASSSDGPVETGKSIADAYRAQNAAEPPPYDPTQGDTIAPQTRAFLAPAPNTTYGTVLPLARDEKTGQIRLALPSSLRSLALGGLDLAEAPITGTVTPEGTSALAAVMMGGGLTPSVARGTGAAIAAVHPLAPPEPPPIPPTVTADNLLSPETRAKIAEGGQAKGPSEPMRAAPPDSTAQPPPVPRTSAEAKAIASAHYDQVERSGGNLTPEFTNKFIEEARKIAPQTEEGKIISGNTTLTDLNARLGEMQDKPITLRGAQEMDEALGSLIDKEIDARGQMSKEGKQLLDLQSTFRDMIANAGPGDIEGGPEGFTALVTARKAWAQAMKMADVERIATKAQGQAQPSTGIVTGARTLLSNAKRLRGYSPEEIAALERARDRGILGDLMYVFGSRLIPYAAGAGGLAAQGPVGAMTAAGIAHFGSAALRDAAFRLQNRRLQNALSVIGRGVPPAPNALQTPP